MTSKSSTNPDEQLLDPRLIPNSVRRSLLALHRESQENVSFLKKKETTQSELDVHDAFLPWKSKMKSKLKYTHHPPTRPHSNTFSFLSITENSNEQDRQGSQDINTQNNYGYLRSTSPLARRSLKYYPQYSTQSTSESETTPVDLSNLTNIHLTIDKNQSTEKSS